MLEFIYFMGALLFGIVGLCYLGYRICEYYKENLGRSYCIENTTFFSLGLTLLTITLVFAWPATLFIGAGILISKGSESRREKRQARVQERNQNRLETEQLAREHNLY